VTRRKSPVTPDDADLDSGAVAAGDRSGGGG